MPEASGDARLRSILVATDFSRCAESAVEWAACAASAHGSKLTIVHAVPQESRLHLTLRTRRLHADAVNRLKGLEQSLQSDDLNVRGLSVAGRAHEVIVTSAAEARADMIVIGARGLGGLERTLLGSTSDRVIRSSPLPVLTIHPRNGSPGPLPETILVATAFTEESARATSMAVRLLRGRGTIVLLHAIGEPLIVSEPVGVPLPPSDLRQAEAAARHELETLAAEIRSRSLAVETVVDQADPRRAIVDIAQRFRVDLVAMGTQRLSQFSRMLIGSTASYVVHHAPCPVLTVRQPADKSPVELSAESALDESTPYQPEELK